MSRLLSPAPEVVRAGGAQTGLGVRQPNPITWGHSQNWDSTATLGAETPTPAPCGGGTPGPAADHPCTGRPAPRGSPTEHTSSLL